MVIEQIIGIILLIAIVIAAIGIYYYNKIEIAIDNILKEFEDEANEECKHNILDFDIYWPEDEKMKIKIKCKNCDKEIERNLFDKKK